MVRPILNKWHPQTSKPTYWFPTLFCLGLVTSIVLMALGIIQPLLLFAFYFLLIFCDSLLKNRNVAVALLSLMAVSIQFIGYGYGFLKSTLLIAFSSKKPQEVFPNLFFKTDL